MTRESERHPAGLHITISNIKDREDSKVPRSALKSIVDRVSDAIEEIGLKARVEASENRG